MPRDEGAPPTPLGFTLTKLRTWLMRGFVVVVAIVLGGYGILVATRLILRVHW